MMANAALLSCCTSLTPHWYCLPCSRTSAERFGHSNYLKFHTAKLNPSKKQECHNKNGNNQEGSGPHTKEKAHIFFQGRNGEEGIYWSTLTGPTDVASGCALWVAVQSRVERDRSASLIGPVVLRLGVRLSLNLDGSLGRPGHRARWGQKHRSWLARGLLNLVQSLQGVWNMSFQCAVFGTICTLWHVVHVLLYVCSRSMKLASICFLKEHTIDLSPSWKLCASLRKV